MMRQALAALLAVAVATTPVVAQVLPANSLWAKAADTPKEQIPALCDQMVANAEKNRVGMVDAAYLYFGGKVMGVQCVQIDYLKALDLLRQAGDRPRFDNFVRLIKGRADQGNARAAKALKAADLSPF